MCILSHHWECDVLLPFSLYSSFHGEAKTEQIKGAICSNIMVSANMRGVLTHR